MMIDDSFSIYIIYIDCNDKSIDINVSLIFFCFFYARTQIYQIGSFFFCLGSIYEIIKYTKEFKKLKRMKWSEIQFKEIQNKTTTKTKFFFLQNKKNFTPQLSPLSLSLSLLSSSAASFINSVNVCLLLMVLFSSKKKNFFFIINN